MDIAERLRAAREAAKLTQEQVAHKAGMHMTQYNGYERGRSRPAPTTLERLAAALETSTSALSGQADGAREPMGSQTVGLDDRLDGFRADVAAMLGIAPERVDVRIQVH